MCKIRLRPENIRACHIVTKNVESPLDYAISRSRLNQGRAFYRNGNLPASSSATFCAKILASSQPAHIALTTPLNPSEPTRALQLMTV